MLFSAQYPVHIVALCPSTNFDVMIAASLMLGERLPIGILLPPAPSALLSGSLRLKRENREPELVKKPDREPTAPKTRAHTGERPWMLGH
jgi:hypothetical protein